jgi:hypothetical protein
MGVRARVGTWFPDRPPAWSEVFVATVFFVLYGTQLVFEVLSGSVPSWPGLIAGFGFTMCFIAVSNSPLSTRFEQWLEHSRVVSRIFLLIALLIVSLSLPVVLPEPLYFTALRVPITLYFLYVVAFVVWKRDVSGLNPARNTTD